MEQERCEPCSREGWNLSPCWGYSEHPELGPKSCLNFFTPHESPTKPHPCCVPRPPLFVPMETPTICHLSFS